MRLYLLAFLLLGLFFVGVGVSSFADGIENLKQQNLDRLEKLERLQKR